MPNPNKFKTHKDYLNWYRKYREEKREKIRAYNLKYNKEWRLKNGYHAERKWEDSNLLKVKVGKITRYAINNGKIERLNCEVNNCGKKGQAHHNDYSESLDVIFLCARHHKWTHLNFNEKDLKKIKKDKLLRFLLVLNNLKN